ncbi:serendipity locus protein delta [Eupeodes corollae]|uniref:serendipity locus protein delta n=1 Tax=Eupeodes corollae TaxID=290404 RepID=UPI0024909FE7|nr:serendipity locus protein delta [Eupeodes corollae]
MKTKCILCKIRIAPNLGYYNIGETKIEFSKKTIKNILFHLSKCIKADYYFEDSSCVCNFCYEKLVKYDEIMIKLLNCQKELSKMLEDSIKTLEIDDSDEDIRDDDNTSNFSAHNDSDSMSDSNQEFLDDSTSEHTNRSFECSICNKTLKTKHSLRNHLDTHKTEVKCKICGALCRDEEYLELHMNIHEGKTENECRYCPKRYSRRSNVIRHMQFHWDKKKFQCEKCGLRFSQAHILYNHKMVHEAEEQPIICQICEQSFKSKKTFRHHMITHQEDRPMHPCEICGKKFTERYTLKMHLKTHTAGREEEPETPKKINAQPKRFPCIICEKVLTTLESLENHRAKEHDVICSETIFVQFNNV